MHIYAVDFCISIRHYVNGAIKLESTGEKTAANDDSFL
jgi:hypothetical protein